MNDWITITNIFLGLGSVSLSCALFNFLILTRLSSHPFSAYMALTLLSSLFLIAALAYVVGLLDYLVGNKNTAKEQSMVKPTKHHFLKYFSPLWSLHIGAFSTPVLLFLQLGEVYSSFNGNIIFIFGIPSPMFVSIVGGATAGIVVLLIHYILGAR